MLGENEIMVRQVPAMLNATDIKLSIEQFINDVLNSEADFVRALIKIIVNDDFSNNPTEWNTLLRELEECGLTMFEYCYHQISDKDLEGWFK